MPKQEPEEQLHKRYQIGAKLAEKYIDDKVSISEIVTIAGEKKSLYNLLVKWDEATDVTTKADLFDKIKKKLPKKKGLFG